MEEVFKAIVLGIVQGLTEFLPISSSAHLRIVPSLFGWNDLGAAYTAVIQVGTMMAIIIYFGKDLIEMILAVLRGFRTKNWMNDPYSKLFVMICVGTVPILFIGYTLKGVIRNEFRDMYLIAGNIIFFSLVIYTAEKYTSKNRKIGSMNIIDSILIGLFQSLALVPGTSRSGSTISGGFIRNLDRESATRYSFLLSIPAVLISGVYELFSERHQLLTTGNNILGLITATVVSGVVGYWSIGFLLNYLKKHSMMLFIVYRVIFGIIIIILLLTKIILP